MSLLVVTAIIFLLWIGAMLFYLFVSNQYSTVAQEIESVQALLEQSERDAE